LERKSRQLKKLPSRDDIVRWAKKWGGGGQKDFASKN